jgi:hypothetical protein
MFLIRELSLLLVHRAIPDLISSLASMGCRMLELRQQQLPFALPVRRLTCPLFLSVASLLY